MQNRVKSLRSCGINPALFLLCILFLGVLACAVDKSVLTGSYPSETQVESASFDLINQDRRQQGLPELTLDVELSTIARGHSNDMRDRGYFDHNTPDGKTFVQRLQTGGVTFVFAGENLARIADNSNPAAWANTNFLADQEHRDVLLNHQFTRAGVGVARSGNTYWITQDFIKP